VTAERHQAPASEVLLTGEVAGQWAQVHLVLLDGATVEFKVPGSLIPLPIVIPR